MRKEAEALKRPEHWGEATRIRVEADHLRETEKRLFSQDYEQRVEADQRRLIDKAGSRQRTLAPAWGGSDRFDPDLTLRQAVRNVRAEHEQVLERIAAMETRALSGLVARAHLEAAGPTKPETFEPSGPDQVRRMTGPEQ